MPEGTPLAILSAPSTNPSQIEADTNDANSAIEAYNASPTPANKNAVCDAISQLIAEIDADIASLQAVKAAAQQLAAEAGCGQ